MDVEEPPVKIEIKEEYSNNNSDDEHRVSSTEDAKPIPFGCDVSYIFALKFCN